MLEHDVAIKLFFSKKQEYTKKYVKTTILMCLYFIHLIRFLWEPIMCHPKIQKWIGHCLYPGKAYSMAEESRPW